MNGIATGVHYPIPVHRQESYENFAPVQPLEFTDEWSKTVLSLPIYPNLESNDQQYVIEMIRRFYDEHLENSKEVREAKISWSKVALALFGSGYWVQN